MWYISHTNSCFAVRACATFVLVLGGVHQIYARVGVFNPGTETPTGLHAMTCKREQKMHVGIFSVVVSVVILVSLRVNGGRWK